MADYQQLPDQLVGDETTPDLSVPEKSHDEIPDIWQDDYLRLQITTDCMKIATEIRGIEYESIGDYLEHVDILIAKAKAS